MVREGAAAAAGWGDSQLIEQCLSLSHTRWPQRQLYHFGVHKETIVRVNGGVEKL